MTFKYKIEYLVRHFRQSYFNNLIRIMIKEIDLYEDSNKNSYNRGILISARDNGWKINDARYFLFPPWKFCGVNSYCYRI